MFYNSSVNITFYPLFLAQMNVFVDGLSVTFSLRKGIKISKLRVLNRDSIPFVQLTNKVEKLHVKFIFSFHPFASIASPITRNVSCTDSNRGRKTILTIAPRDPHIFKNLQGGVNHWNHKKDSIENEWWKFAFFPWSQISKIYFKKETWFMLSFQFQVQQKPSRGCMGLDTAWSSMCLGFLLFPCPDFSDKIWRNFRSTSKNLNKIFEIWRMRWFWFQIQGHWC